jgi:hypothetical protein
VTVVFKQTIVQTNNLEEFSEITFGVELNNSDDVTDIFTDVVFGATRRKKRVTSKSTNNFLHNDGS